MKATKRIYLSGGMEYADNEGRDWRYTLQEWIESELGWTVFNPFLAWTKAMEQFWLPMLRALPGASSSPETDRQHR